jgi:hypothetical protein
VRLCAVIQKCLLEPRVLQSVLGRDALLGVVYEYSLQQVKELAVELGVWRYGFLRRSEYVICVQIESDAYVKLLHSLHKLL